MTFPKVDVITLSQVLHDWDLPHKQHLIKSAYEALPSGGALVVVETLIDDARRKNAFGLLTSLNALIEIGDGFDYTGADFKKWAMDAGFRRVEVIHADGADQRDHRLQVAATRRLDLRRSRHGSAGASVIAPWRADIEFGPARGPCLPKPTLSPSGASLSRLRVPRRLCEPELGHVHIEALILRFADHVGLMPCADIAVQA